MDADMNHNNHRVKTYDWIDYKILIEFRIIYLVTFVKEGPWIFRGGGL